jgi:ATP-binding cassette subfamily B protein
MTDTMSIPVLPAPVKAKLTELGVADDVKIALAADLTRDNVYGQEWLAATTEKLFVLSVRNGTAELLALYLLADIKKIRAVGLVGSGMVQIESNGQTHRLVSYSNARSAEFNWAVEDIDDLIKKNVPDQEHKDRTRHMCAICGLPLPAELNKCPRCAEKGKTFRRILLFSRPYSRQIFLLFLTILAGTGIGLVIPYMSKLFIDTILKPDTVSGIFAHAGWLLPAALVLLAAHIGQLVFSSLQERLAGVMGYHTVFDVRAAVYKKLQELSLSYFDRHQTGAILARVNQDTAELQRFMVDFIPLLAESLLTLVGVGVFLFILSWKLTIFVLIPISGIIFYIRRIMPRIRVTFSRFFFSSPGAAFGLGQRLALRYSGH